MLITNNYFDGRSARCEVPIYSGAPARDLDRAGFTAKFEDCHRHYLEAGGSNCYSVEQMIDAAMPSAAADLGPLFETFRH